GQCGVDSVPAGEQHAQSGLRRQRLRGRDDVARQERLARRRVRKIEGRTVRLHHAHTFTLSWGAERTLPSSNVESESANHARQSHELLRTSASCSVSVPTMSGAMRGISTVMKSCSARMSRWRVWITMSAEPNATPTKRTFAC